ARRAWLGVSSTTTTSWPRSLRARATAAPLIPSPTTSARARSPTGEMAPDGRGEEVGIERTHGQGRAQPGENPEPHDHRRLRPAHELEVMVDGRHAEHAPVEEPEGGHLHDDRQGHDDEHAAHDRQE